MLKRTERLLREAVRDEAFPGAQAAIHRGDFEEQAAIGRLSYATGAFDVSPETVYDLASLTKVIATTAMTMVYVAQERISLDDVLGKFLEGIADARLAKVTIRQLLAHDAGLPAWLPLYERLPEEEIAAPGAKERLIEFVCQTPLVREPGAGPVYSDLDMMLLGALLEKAGGRSLDLLAARHIFEPLGMNAAFHPAQNQPNAFVAPTRKCLWRRRTLIGQVDDQNTYAAGGVLGQAGVFGNAQALQAFGREILAALEDDGRVFEGDVVRVFTQRAFPDSNHGFCLGFDGRSPRGSLLPDTYGPRTIGHWGFTGVGFWIDPDQETVAVVLTNRVHPDPTNEKIQFWRPRLFKSLLADAI